MEKNVKEAVVYNLLTNDQVREWEMLRDIFRLLCDDAYWTAQTRFFELPYLNERKNVKMEGDGFKAYYPMSEEGETMLVVDVCPAFSCRWYAERKEVISGDGGTVSVRRQKQQ